jgi:hypothetical protein
MKLQILHVPDCPNAAVLAARLDEVLAGRADVAVEQVDVADQDEAAALGMTGSPTLLVDGNDPFAVPGVSASMSCRLYVDDTGTVSGAPSASQLRAVLAGHRPTTARREGLTLAGWRAAGTGSRQAALPPALRSLHQAVLRHFLNEGDAPDIGWIRGQASGLGVDPDAAIGQLTAADLVHFDRPSGGGVPVLRCAERTPGAAGQQSPGVGDVRDRRPGYPADGRPRHHDHRGRSSTGEPVTVEAHDGRWLWTPASTMVLVAQTAASGPSVECSCGHVNFYTRAEQADAYLDDHPALNGRVIDQRTAVELAGGVFGGLLRNPA